MENYVWLCIWSVFKIVYKEVAWNFKSEPYIVTFKFQLYLKNELCVSCCFENYC